MIDNQKIKIAIDRGGTFTDVWADIPGKGEITIKLLSVDPNNYEDAPIEGIRRILSIFYGKNIPRNHALPKDCISSIRMGTTVATNALLERKGAKHVLLVTKGFKDALIIGDQSRPKLFELAIKKPDLLYDKVVEINERVTPECFSDDLYGQMRAVESPEVVRSKITGEYIRILDKLDESEVRDKLKALREEGYETLAVCLMHSYIYDDHERMIQKIAEEEGFAHISISSTVTAGMIKMVPRCSSASADSYLAPVIKRYVDGFASGFEGGNLDGVSCEFMQSDGGLVNYSVFSGLKGILSGPAGGVVGYAETCYDGKNSVIGFDMGGTSTDVSRYGGLYEHVFETTTAGVTIQSPQLDINTVAAGGGSICVWKNGLFHVGPESASAHPGPACYRKGGPLTITDCNLYLGRILVDYFPSIFGPNEDEPLDRDAAVKHLTEFSAQVYQDTGNKMSLEEIALGFIDVANESMCRPIRALTEARGYEISNHILSSFGGAGGQHACEIAHKLNINKIAIHKHSSILSAYGMSLADLVQEVQEPSNLFYTQEVYNSEIKPRLEKCRKKALELLKKQGVDTEDIIFQSYLNMRYKGTDTSLMILQPEDGDFLAEFEREHKREFTFLFENTRPIIVDDIRARAISRRSKADLGKTFRDDKNSTFSEISVKDSASGVRSVTFQGYGTLNDVPVFDISSLLKGQRITGPAVLIDDSQTIILIPEATAKVLSNHIYIELDSLSKNIEEDSENMTVDPIKLSVFSHRFMGIAEQMGRTLQKISVSLNIKERYDFSCAIFGPDGELVANAPHVPVHLGSMSYAVRYQHEKLKGKLKPGDVLVSNHPEAGGTHLPDITVITPVFGDHDDIVFYTASRGHHTDIGGLGGTSFPPDSKFLWQEGAAIISFKLVENGEFKEKEIIEILEKPGTYPGCAPSRRINDNISDLKAQIAANNKGSALIQELIREYSEKTVHLYMRAIQENAAVAVRQYLKDCVVRLGTNVLTSEDTMDNGSIIRMKITIDGTTGNATFDFTGTTPEIYSNSNAPPSITYSAIIYCMRLLVGQDIPMNQGCLTPINVILPKGCLLNPSNGPAVVAGNTHTSQRLADVILKPFEVIAASQGDMNCWGFYGKGGVDENGKELAGFAYVYGETCCGGSGAGPGFHGASAVQIHMTNTKTTDVEVIERKSPIIVREFSVREGSGGKGKWKGGCGVTRDFECRLPLTFACTCERRVTEPYGMKGGGNGERGLNLWLKKGKSKEEDKYINVGPRVVVQLDAGDHFILNTPGGGGWGDPDDPIYVDTTVKQKEYIPLGNGTISSLISAQNSSQ